MRCSCAIALLVAMTVLGSALVRGAPDVSKSNRGVEISVTKAAKQPCVAWARDGDTLTVEWTGRFEKNTTIFGTSQNEPPARTDADRAVRYYNGPYDFVLGDAEIMDGADHGLQGMCLGETRQLIVPAQLSVGGTGMPKLTNSQDRLLMEYKLIKVAPRFNIETTDRPALCKSAVGEGSKVGVHYTAHAIVLNDQGSKEWLKLHDSRTDSDDRFWGPFEVTRGPHLIEGLYKGLLGMCVNETRHITIPPSNAYGATGISGYVPGDATLYYTLELEYLEKPAYQAEVVFKPDECQAQVKLGDRISLHYSIFHFATNSGNKHSLKLLQSTRNGAAWGPFVFDASTDMIDGLRVGLHGMCPGEKRRLTIPPAMAWGSAGVAGYIQADATVVVLVEVVAVDANPTEQQRAKEL